MSAAEAHSAGSGRVRTALVVGQLGMHSAMAGLRMAAPLQLLREGQGAWTVGLLLALFAAAPVMLALYAGRLADRLGYHRPVYLSVAMTVAGGLLAIASTFDHRISFTTLNSIVSGGIAIGAGLFIGGIIAECRLRNETQVPD